MCVCVFACVSVCVCVRVLVYLIKIHSEHEEEEDLRWRGGSSAIRPPGGSRGPAAAQRSRCTRSVGRPQFTAETPRNRSLLFRNRRSSQEGLLRHVHDVITLARNDVIALRYLLLYGLSFPYRSESEPEVSEQTIPPVIFTSNSNMRLIMYIIWYIIIIK